MLATVETATRNYARGAIMAFLQGKKTLNWLLGTIRSSGVRGERLSELFESLQHYGESDRHVQAASASREQGLLR